MIAVSFSTIMPLKDYEYMNTLIEILIGLFVGATTTYIKMRLKRQDAENKAQKNGIRALLRDKLITTYSNHVERQGYCPIYVKDTAKEIHDQYKALGGNGTVEALYKALMELPTTKE